MPKDKKASSKTARVLGLLTSSTPDQAEAEAAAGKPSKLPELPKPSDDVTVEAEVRGALEQELETTLEQAPPPRRRRSSKPALPPEPEPAPTPEPEPEPPAEPPLSSLQEAKPVYEPAPRVSEAPSRSREKPKAKPAPADIPLPVNPTVQLEPDIFCFNITQALVEAKVDKYIKLFGLCNCPRCRVDVIALALSNLPPKYVVAKENEMVPLLSVYEGKYNAAIVSQVMNACKLVMEHPRHDRLE